MSIGAIPAACGGTVISSRDGDGNAGSGNAATGQGGSSGKIPGGPGKMLPPSMGGTGVVTGTAGSLSIGGSFGIAGAEGHPMTRCTAPQYDANTGLIACAEGYQHRPQAIACGELTGIGGEPPTIGGAGPSAQPNLPRATGNVGCGEAVGGYAGEGPTASPKCGDFANGYCKTYDGNGGQFSICESGCSTDAECGPGFMCLCNEPDSPTGGACVPSNCRTDSDCGDGYRCASYSMPCGGSDAFYCQRADDQCLTDADCPAFVTCSPEDGPRICDEVACGRPFLVQERARVAATVASAEWALPGAPPHIDHLTATERTALAQHWTKMGQMEHASIAAFARFSLQLLALGAPPELVDACTQALGDETAHTKLCFGIASAYAGRAIGPGPLDVSGSLEVTALADIVDLVIAEGCFGETGAALEALEAADAATDPVIVAAYSQIARDEQRHAELAFRFVRWALERDPVAVTPRVVQALAEQPYSSPAVQDVVEPCLYAVLARRQAA